MGLPKTFMGQEPRSWTVIFRDPLALLIHILKLKRGLNKKYRFSNFKFFIDCTKVMCKFIHRKHNEVYVTNGSVFYFCWWRFRRPHWHVFIFPRKVLDSLFRNLCLIPIIAENPTSHIWLRSCKRKQHSAGANPLNANNGNSLERWNFWKYIVKLVCSIKLMTK